MEYTGGASWNNVGVSGFSTGLVTYPSLAINNQGPFVGYVDGANGNHANAMAYLSGSWVFVGNTDFSAGAASFLCAGFGTNGLEIAYQDATYGYDATVQQFQ